MAIALTNQVLNNSALTGIISVDENQRIRIVDQGRAMQILAQSDANSPEYRIIQVAMQLSNFQQQEDLRTRVDLGEREITRLATENSRIVDELTTMQMREDSDSLRAAERNDGIIDLVTTIPFSVICPLMLVVGPAKAIMKICIPGSEAMRQRERLMERYRVSHPDASLTEAYTYAKEHPLPAPSTHTGARRNYGCRR